MHIDWLWLMIAATLDHWLLITGKSVIISLGSQQHITWHLSVMYAPRSVKYWPAYSDARKACISSSSIEYRLRVSARTASRTTGTLHKSQAPAMRTSIQSNALLIVYRKECVQLCVRGGSGDKPRYLD